uniref:Rab-GAP TBC domain-containing protein n=1 Tax=Arcella intermedia TaxID=1963864 RepID=A0A6B2LDH8_9EUKA
MKKFRKIIVRGKLPKHLRGIYWSLALGIDDMDSEKLHFSSLLQESVPTKDIKQIDKDVARTMRTHKMFSIRFGDGQRKLFQILRAYAAYDIEVGYVQSMSTIAAMLLFFIEEEEKSFLALVSLFQTRGLRWLLIRDLEGLRETAFSIFTKLNKHFFPELADHFEEIGLHPSLFLTNWFLEIFFGYVPFGVLLQVWDLFILDGYSFLYSLVLSVLSFNYDEILALPDPESFNDLKHNPFQAVNPRQILNIATTKYKLSFQKIHKITGMYPHPL